jgi:hypothetical protein
VAESGPRLRRTTGTPSNRGRTFARGGGGFGQRRRRIGGRRRERRGLRPLLPGRPVISGLIRGKGGDEVLEEGPVGCERRKVRYRITVAGSAGSEKYLD